MAYVSHVCVETIAECPFSIALEYAEDFFRAAEAGGEGSVIRLGMPAGIGALIGRRVILSFGVHSDLTDRGRANEEVAFRWSAGSPLFPAFHGTVRMRIAGRRTRLIVEGDYVPPGGVLGSIFDRMIGRRIARAGLYDFARRLAATLAERERRWRAGLGETASAS
jgi:hypothetical protein